MQLVCQLLPQFIPQHIRVLLVFMVSKDCLAPWMLKGLLEEVWGHLLVLTLDCILMGLAVILQEMGESLTLKGLSQFQGFGIG
jgi:hypothetical protein